MLAASRRCRGDPDPSASRFSRTWLQAFHQPWSRPRCRAVIDVPTNVHTFRITPRGREALLRFCCEKGITQSDALRLLISDGPVAFSAFEPVPEPYVPFSGGLLSVGDGRTVDLELVRQRTNLSQCVNVFEDYAYNNAIDKFDAESSDRFVELPDLIRDRLFVVIHAVEDTSSFVCGLASCDGESTSATERVKARMASAYLQLLALKSQTFHLTPSGYVRFTVPLLDAIWNHAYGNGKASGRNGTSHTFIPVVDLECLCEDFRACGKVLNDSAHHLNSEFKDFVFRDEDVNVLKMEVLLGKLDVAVGYYESFRGRHSIPSKAGGI